MEKENKASNKHDMVMDSLIYTGAQAYGDIRELAERGKLRRVWEFKPNMQDYEGKPVMCVRNTVIYGEGLWELYRYIENTLENKSYTHRCKNEYLELIVKGAENNDIHLIFYGYLMEYDSNKEMIDNSNKQSARLALIEYYRNIKEDYGKRERAMLIKVLNDILKV